MERILSLDRTKIRVINTLAETPYLLTIEQVNDLVAFVQTRSSKYMDFRALIEEYVASHPVETVEDYP